jgi:hypothetical protein
MAETAILSGGPQDGARVRKSGDDYRLPDAIFVGPKWLGDGFAAWSDEHCDRFPVKYQRNGNLSRFTFAEYVSPV